MNYFVQRRTASSLFATAVLATALLSGLLNSPASWARGYGGGQQFRSGWRGGFGHYNYLRGSRFGFYMGPGYGIGYGFGGPWGWGYPGSGYYSPYWAAPPVVIRRSPPTYIERADPARYWYYCQASQAYYPKVQQCPGGWRAVAPLPTR